MTRVGASQLLIRVRPIKLDLEIIFPTKESDPTFVYRVCPIPVVIPRNIWKRKFNVRTTNEETADESVSLLAKDTFSATFETTVFFLTLQRKSYRQWRVIKNRKNDRSAGECRSQDRRNEILSRTACRYSSVNGFLRYHRVRSGGEGVDEMRFWISVELPNSLSLSQSLYAI